MVSTPKMEYQVFLCTFQKNPAMAALKISRKWENSFKPKVTKTIAKFIGIMQKKSLVLRKVGWTPRHASFPPRRSVKLEGDGSQL